MDIVTTDPPPSHYLFTRNKFIIIANPLKYMKCFDLELIKKILSDSEIKAAMVGLYEDWDNTKEIIFKDGQYYCDNIPKYLTEKTPMIETKLKQGFSVRLPCYKEIIPCHNDILPQHKEMDIKKYYNLTIKPRL